MKRKLLDFFNLSKVDVRELYLILEELPKEHGWRSSNIIGRKYVGSFERQDATVDFEFIERFPEYGTATGKITETRWDKHD
jgi:hypothetical protein